MVASYVIWYIVVGNAAGVLVFLWIWMLIGFYALLKFPKFVVVGKSQRRIILPAAETDYLSSLAICRQYCPYHRLRIAGPSPRCCCIRVQRPASIPDLSPRTVPSGDCCWWSLRCVDLDDFPLPRLRRLRAAQRSWCFTLHARKFLFARTRDCSVARQRRGGRHPKEGDSCVQSGKGAPYSLWKTFVASQ